jgi:dimethylsulfone monooxygenase
VSLEDYSVSNRGLRAGLVGTAEQVAERIGQLEAVGVDLLLLQFSPQLEEMEIFSAAVMPLVPVLDTQCPVPGLVIRGSPSVSPAAI